MFGKRRAEVSVREKRRARRSDVNTPALVQTTAYRLRATIVSISASGARLIVSDRPPPRQDVQIIVNGLYLFARIVWRRDNAFGVMFENGNNGYSPAEIYRAVEDASEPIYELDRDIILSSLLNRTESSCGPAASHDAD